MFATSLIGALLFGPALADPEKEVTEVVEQVLAALGTTEPISFEVGLLQEWGWAAE